MVSRGASQVPAQAGASYALRRLQYPARAAAREASAAKRVEFVSVRARSCIFVHGDGALNGSFAFKVMFAWGDAILLSASREDSLVARRA